MEHIAIISFVLIILGWNIHSMCFGNLPESIRGIVGLAILAVAMFFAPFLLNGV